MNPNLVIINSIRSLLSVGLILGEDNNKSTDNYLLNAMLAINQACSDFAFGRTDAETFLDMIESTEGIEMDDYLDSLEIAIKESENILKVSIDYGQLDN